MRAPRAAAFFVAFQCAIVGAAGTSSSIAFAQQSPTVAAKTVAPGILVAGSITPADIAAFKANGVSLIVDLLPDEEASPQARSAPIEAAARQAGIDFVYAPTPSSPLSMKAVELVGKALAVGGRPALLYCRSGARGTRAWALYEASRPGGLDAAAISRAAAAAGYSVEDVRAEIERRIAAR